MWINTHWLLCECFHAEIGLGAAQNKSQGLVVFVMDTLSQARAHTPYTHTHTANL